MGKKKKSSDVEVVANKNLIIDESLFYKNAPKYVKDFNNYYEKFCELNEVLLTEDEEKQRLENGVEAAIIIASEFDFSFDFIKNNKTEYLKFARDMLYQAGGHPNNDSKAMIYLIKALYGYNNIAYSHENEHLEVNVINGNEWVDYLERNAKNRVLKAYALTLRCYQYIVNGEKLNMTTKQRIVKSEKDLIYATKWDEDNYFAYFALGLIYLDNGTTKYNKDKALDNFNKVLSYENRKVELDRYLTKEEKERAMNLARKQIEVLKNR